MVGLSGYHSLFSHGEVATRHGCRVGCSRHVIESANFYPTSPFGHTISLTSPKTNVKNIFYVNYVVVPDTPGVK